MSDRDRIPEEVCDSGLQAVAERLKAIIAVELPCDPAPEAIAGWIAQAIEAGFTRAFAINAESCTDAQCVPHILAELQKQKADSGDLAIVSEVLSRGARDALRNGPLAPVLTSALHASVDETLRQVSARANGDTVHARCVRSGHEVVILFDHEPKFDWLYTGARHRLRDEIAKVGCDAQLALTQEVDLSQGGKLYLPGYEVVVECRRGGLQAHVQKSKTDVAGAIITQVPVTTEVEQVEPAAKPIRQRQWAIPESLRRVAQILVWPFRALHSVELNVATLSTALMAIIGYIRNRPTRVAIVTCIVAATVCLTMLVGDVYGSLSGEMRAPSRPLGFFIGQYNKAGPWGDDRRPYGLYIPPHFQRQQGPFPLIVYLHGYGERTPRQLFSAGLPLSIAARFGEGSDKGRFEFMVLLLHDPSGYWIPDSREGSDAMEVLDYVMTRHHIDPMRVYLTGVSSGGAGVWRYAEAYPDRWAALAPVGSNQIPDLGRIPHIPTWMFLGERDEMVPIQDHRNLVKKLNEAGGQVRLTEFPEKGHTVSSETYDRRVLYDWLATKSR